jgi:hypothetical protein
MNRSGRTAKSVSYLSGNKKPRSWLASSAGMIASHFKLPKKTPERLEELT